MSHKDGVMKNKNGGICERFSEGKNQNNKEYCTKVVDSEE